MMTVMEAKAEAVARVLAGNANAWAKAQADEASKVLQSLLAKGQLSPQDFAQAVTEVSGNHSAMRQLLEKHGLLESQTAMPAFLAKAVERRGEIEREIAAREAANAKEREEMTAKQPKKA